LLVIIIIIIIIGEPTKSYSKNISIKESVKKCNNLYVLDKGKTAIYIDSGPSLDKVNHLSGLVKADKYILSDLDFNHEYLEHDVDGMSVITTNRDGFDILKDDKSIGFILVDQAVSHLFKADYGNISKDCVFYFPEFIPSVNLLNNPLASKRVGLELISRTRLYKKVKEASKKDLISVMILILY